MNPQILTRLAGTLEEESKWGKGGVSVRVLDLGCGTGRHLVHLANHRKFKVYGFDFSPLAIESAKNGLSVQGLSATLAVRDMTQPFEYSDGFFDGLISIRVIGHTFEFESKDTLQILLESINPSDYLPSRAEKQQVSKTEIYASR